MNRFLRTFGNPRRPRANLLGGLIATSLGAFLFGYNLAPGAPAQGLATFVLFGVIIAAGIGQFLLGLGSIALDESTKPRSSSVPKDAR